MAAPSDVAGPAMRHVDHSRDHGGSNCDVLDRIGHYPRWAIGSIGISSVGTVE
jgi:hypothetical protein